MGADGTLDDLLLRLETGKGGIADPWRHVNLTTAELDAMDPVAATLQIRLRSVLIGEMRTKLAREARDAAAKVKPRKKKASPSRTSLDFFLKPSYALLKALCHTDAEPAEPAWAQVLETEHEMPDKEPATDVSVWAPPQYVPLYTGDGVTTITDHDNLIPQIDESWLADTTPEPLPLHQAAEEEIQEPEEHILDDLLGFAEEPAAEEAVEQVEEEAERVTLATALQRVMEGHATSLFERQAEEEVAKKKRPQRTKQPRPERAAVTDEEREAAVSLAAKHLPVSLDNIGTLMTEISKLSTPAPLGHHESDRVPLESLALLEPPSITGSIEEWVWLLRPFGGGVAQLWLSKELPQVVPSDHPLLSSPLMLRCPPSVPDEGPWVSMGHSVAQELAGLRLTTLSNVESGVPTVAADSLGIVSTQFLGQETQGDDNERAESELFPTLHAGQSRPPMSGQTFREMVLHSRENDKPIMDVNDALNAVQDLEELQLTKIVQRLEARAGEKRVTDQLAFQTLIFAAHNINQDGGEVIVKDGAVMHREM